MCVCDVSWTISTDVCLSSDHGYTLFSAIATLVPAVHDSTTIGIHPITGKPIGDRMMRTTIHSRLVLRAPVEVTSELIQLSGRQIEIAGAAMQIRVPTIFQIRPSTILHSRLVTTKNGQDPSRFSNETRRQLDQLSICSQAKVHVGRRRTVRIKQREIVGFELVVEGLDAVESIAIQTNGLGGRRRMGCGLFTPYNGLRKEMN